MICYGRLIKGLGISERCDLVFVPLSTKFETTLSVPSKNLKACEPNFPPSGI